MDNIESDIKILKKVLNSELFMDKFSDYVKYVSVEKYGNGIDIVLFVNDGNRYHDEIRKDVHKFINTIAKMTSITSQLNIYP